MSFTLFTFGSRCRYKISTDLSCKDSAIISTECFTNTLASAASRAMYDSTSASEKTTLDIASKRTATTNKLLRQSIILGITKKGSLYTSIPTVAKAVAEWDETTHDVVMRAYKRRLCETWRRRKWSATRGFLKKLALTKAINESRSPK